MECLVVNLDNWLPAYPDLFSRIFTHGLPTASEGVEPAAPVETLVKDPDHRVWDYPGEHSRPDSLIYFGEAATHSSRLGALPIIGWAAVCIPKYDGFAGQNGFEVLRPAYDRGDSIYCFWSSCEGALPTIIAWLHLMVNSKSLAGNVVRGLGNPRVGENPRSISSCCVVVIFVSGIGHWPPCRSER